MPISFPQIVEWCGGSQSLALFATLAATAIVCPLLFFAVRAFVELVVKAIVRKTPTRWDDDLLNNRVLSALSQLVPPLILMWVFTTLRPFAPWIDVCIRLNNVYLTAIVGVIVCAVIAGVRHRLRHEPRFSTYPIDGLCQMLKLVTIAFCIIVSIAILFNRKPLTILAGLGASAAVLSLVFKDTILGFVAGIQLSANNMLARGDWLVASTFNADGEVESIGLTTVKVRNWDKSVTTIPTYALISNSFQNWQKMREFGGRRIARAFYVDADSIATLPPERLGELLAAGFVTKQEATLKNPVNLGLLAAWIERRIKADPRFSSAPETLTMVRQLDPTPSGIPIQVYCFTATTDWIAYESLQAELFNLIYATLPRFGLRIFQTTNIRLR